jgi:ComF family protein
MAAPRTPLHHGGMQRIAMFMHAVADLLLPPVCLGCDGPIDARDEARLACRVCRARLRAIPSPVCARCGASVRMTGRSRTEACHECAGWPHELAAARSACLLLPPADRLVHQLKYRGWPALAGPLAECMTTLLLPDVMRRATLCVPVPTTAGRMRERGYNQAEALARAYAGLTGRALRNALRREGHAGTQTALQPVARRANVAGAFRVEAHEATRIRGAHVLLVDDVLTTGATASACALALAAAGARSIALITFARALDARRLTRFNGAEDEQR